jgi:hypothetical protein
MENIEQIKQTIGEAKDICLIPSKEPEAISSALALFYTLKELNKNVNLIIEEIPEDLKFLAPSLDFISYPKNFVISIPSKVADISQIYYEKNENALKIHLTLENGNIKKDNMSFYFSETKPDLVITLGIKDYSEELTNRLNSFGFLLESPILNIDSLLNQKQDLPQQTENKKFGKINLLEKTSLTEIIFSLIKTAGNGSIKKEQADCLFSGIVIYTKNFKNELTANIFEMAGSLMKAGADLKKITNNLSFTKQNENPALSVNKPNNKNIFEIN